MIPDIWRRCKSWVQLHEKPVSYLLILVLTAVLAFGLGRLSRLEELHEPILIEETANASTGLTEAQDQNPVTQPTTQKAPGADSAKGLYVASKTGTKYYLPWCSGVSRIKEENKVWFKTKEEAVKKGLTPAAGCKGI